MPKICDPPPYNDGQCAGIPYRVHIRQTNLSDNSVYNGVFTLTGGITGLYDEFDVRLDPSTNQMRGYQRQGFYFNSGASNFLWREGFLSGQDPSLTRVKPTSFTITSVERADGQTGSCGDPVSTNCYCSDDSCRVDCPNAPNGFCCIDHSLTDNLLLVLQG